MFEMDEKLFEKQNSAILVWHIPWHVTSAI